MTERFEIKVALMGYVSVGKSTVLNALLGDKFSEVSMRRSTACVNYFRITGAVANEERITSKKDSKIVPDDETEVEVQIQTAQEIHKSISDDNQALRGSNELQERFFDIAMDEPLCKMRHDTDLVLVDIPGLNEADTTMYWNYVKDNWSDFDCAVVVMDALQGVNTEEQVRLLHTVDEYKRTTKDIPIIILGNKVDSPDDHEQQMLVEETRSKAVDIFGAGCSKEELQKLVEKGEEEELTYSSTFIPCSAAGAFIYRSVSNLSLEKFRMMDKSLIDKLGQAEVGRRKWKTMSNDEKVEVIFSVVKDPSGYKECLEATNFLTFLQVFDKFVGGEKNQVKLIKEQIDIIRRSLSLGDSAIKNIERIYRQSERLGLPIGHIEEEFWNLFDPSEDVVLKEMEMSADPTLVGKLMSELISYHELASKLGWKDEQSEVEQRMKELVYRYIHLPLRHNHMDLSTQWCSSSNNTTYYGRDSKLQALTQLSMSPHDWHILISSILLFSSERDFYESFGPEKVVYEQLLAFYASKFTTITSNRYEINFRSTVFKGTRDSDGIFEPAHPENYEDFCRLSMPRDLSDPTHWGHVIWQYCNFCRQLKK